MTEALFYLVSSFWLGALHAATPGHGKTIAAAYIVGARGRPVDAVALGIFVTLSHVAGIVAVAILASLGAAWSVPARIEAYLSLVTALLVVGIGLWMLVTQGRALTRRPAAAADPEGHRHPAGHEDEREHAHHEGHEHPHGHAESVDGALDPGFHRHGWGPAHLHHLDLQAGQRMSWAILLGLGAAGGLLPDPGALAILLAAIASGKPILGLLTVVVFSLGFAAVLVVVGVVAAQVGQIVLTWLEARWLRWVQLGMAVLILVVGLVLTASAWRALSRLV
jgi:nickel/cobalt exporter